jgi:cation:H+ antiporter
VLLIPRPLVPIFVAVLLTLPGLFVAIAHLPLAAPATALLAGLAILTASFLLLWACDTAQSDVSQGLALAVVALVAVLPEYAVDMYFTWQAGKFPDSEYAHYAIANMTGANRLLIGVAWALIAVIYWFKRRRPVRLESDRRLEVGFLGAATLYALFIPIKGSLEWYDGLVFGAIYLIYIVLAGRRGVEEAEVEGPAAYLTALPTVKRRVVTALLFLFSAGIVVANSERFCEGLVGTGKLLGISEFLLVQWLAPIASEAPEFVVATMFALRGNAGLALGSLLSAKLNQWTLLVGMIPGVFAVSSGSITPPMPLNAFQMHEIMLTAAQSLLAVAMLSTLRLTIGQAVLLFTLFIGQLVAPGLVQAAGGTSFLGLHPDQMHPLFTLLYLVATLVLFLDQPQRLRSVVTWLSPRTLVPVPVRHADEDERQ